MHKKTFEPGIHDISNDEYHSSEGISRSGIMEYMKSPLHYHHKYLNPEYIIKPSSPDMVFGSAFHCAVLEPSKFKEDYYISQNFDKRTTIGKAGYAKSLIESKGKILIEQSDLDIIKEMHNMLEEDNKASELIRGAQYEKSIYWIDEETGITCKARPDIWHDGFIVDLKTTRDASYRAFSRDFYSMGYALQLGIMHEATKSIGKPITTFIDLAIEKLPPYAFAIYTIDESVLEFGINQFHHYLKLIKESVDKDKWEGYKVQTIMLPAYANLEE